MSDDRGTDGRAAVDCRRHAACWSPSPCSPAARVGPSQRPALATFGTAQTSVGGTARRQRRRSGPGGPGQQADPIRWESCPDVDSRRPGHRAVVRGRLRDRWWSTASRRTPSVTRPSRSRGPGRPASRSDAPAVVVRPRRSRARTAADRVAAVAAGLSPAVREHFAVITVDLVGTGRSGPIDCLSGYDTRALMTLGVDPTEPASATALAELSRSLTFECGDLAGPELSRVNSTAAADDLDALRAALGTPTLTLIGQGFGATLAAVYADRYPGRVGAAVLDAPADPLRGPRRQGGRDRRRRREGPGHLRRQLRRLRRRLPAGRGPARADREGGQRAGRCAGCRAGAGHHERRQRAADPAAPARRPRTAGRSWRPRWPPRPTATAQPIEHTADRLARRGRRVRLAGRRHHLRLQRQRAADLARPDVRPPSRRSGRRHRCSARTPSAWSASARSWPAPEAALGAVKATGAAPILVVGRGRTIRSRRTRRCSRWPASSHRRR